MAKHSFEFKKKVVLGATIKYVQKRLGHKRVETTLNVYSHLTDKMLHQGNDILDRI